MSKQSGVILPEYRIFETDEYLATINRLPQKYCAFFRKKMEQFAYPRLRREPLEGGSIKKLRGCTPDIWRFRIGEFRIFYTVDTEKHIVNILCVDFRPKAY